MTPCTEQIYEAEIESSYIIEMWMPSNFDLYNLTFFNGKIQPDSSECLMVLKEVIKKGSVSYCGSSDHSTQLSLSDILCYFMSEKFIICDICWLRPTTFEPSTALYTTPVHTFSIQVLIMQRMQHKLQKSCFRCKKNTLHVEYNYVLQTLV